MKCPYCGYAESKVIDSRPAEEGSTIRRRRECLACRKRFTTYEIMERLPLVVVKRDGSRQSFDRVKVINGLVRACEKRPVALSQLEDIAEATITLFGESTTNSSVALYALEQSGITPAAVEYLAGAANTQSLLLTDASAVVVTAEPALTAARIKKEGITAYPLNGLYKKASGFDGYTQAGLFVKAETAEKEPQLVAAYLAAAEDAVTKCTTDLESVAKAAVALEILPNEKVAVAAIPGCNLLIDSSYAQTLRDVRANLKLGGNYGN